MKARYYIQVSTYWYHHDGGECYGPFDSRAEATEAAHDAGLTDARHGTNTPDLKNDRRFTIETHTKVKRLGLLPAFSPGSLADGPTDEDRHYQAMAAGR